MKKILAMLVLMFSLTGCDMMQQMDNTPTKKVETLLNKYQTLDSAVVDNLDFVLAEEADFTEEQRNRYRDIMKNNYQKMTYKIKDEEINGDLAIVTAEIEVVDFSKVMSDAEVYKNEHQDEFMTDNVYDDSKFIDYRLDRLEKATEKVKYTLDIPLTKVDSKWTVDSLSSDNEAKLNGVYEY